jgi:hypothetical protein
MRISVRLFCLSLACVVFMPGCGGGDKAYDGPTGTVTGKVTFKGDPIPEGSAVVFQPKSGEGLPASGAIGSDGSFKLSAKNSFSIPVGIYKISISPPRPKDLTDEEAMNASMKGKNSDTEFKEIPEKYRNPATSGETFEVKEGENSYTLDMKPK